MQLKPIEVKRMTLHSYIATTLEKLEVSDREKEAITKLMFLSKKQFDDLVEDVIEEIERRTLKIRKTSNSNVVTERMHSKKRLSNLTSKRFKNLVLDVFLVFNHKYPTKSTQNLEEIEELIQQLEMFITELKNEDNIVNSIEITTDTNERYKIIKNHIQEICAQNNISQEFIKYLDELVNITPIQTISSPMIFLKATEYLNNTKDKNIYNYHKNNIVNNIKDKSIISDKIVKREMINIMELVLCDLKIDNKIDLKEEIDMLISILVEIKNKEINESKEDGENKEMVDLNKNKPVDLEDNENSISKSSTKSDMKIDEEILNEINENKLEEDTMSLKERSLLCLIKIYHKVKDVTNTDKLQNIIKEIDDAEEVEEKILESALIVKDILHNVN
ncbi:hypothetical protein SLOPH_1681 [Spraguea lophii 42_110]|uniref:GIT Spa2 homology (SHD) domain-containing protein n=1 Tax=Spraguea lophii (strain 42_110) TaxID=1358809 RepID=S7XS77_SPRLO|nr:hypothetical protein SLOPH_1681 [Spraguea lophii 42_110]